MSKVTTGTYFIYIQPPSGTTTNIAQIQNYNTNTMAVARASYVQIYAWAGAGIGVGELITATRRSNNNTDWTDIDDMTITSTQSQTTEPTLFWDNGVLKITITGSNAGVVTIEITIRSGTIVKL